MLSVPVGMTVVFVPQDLEFMGLDRDALRDISPRLIPLIAHDRAGSGGGLVATGILLAFCVWYAPPGRAYRQATFAAGLAGFGCAIGHVKGAKSSVQFRVQALMSFVICARLDTKSNPNPPTDCDRMKVLELSRGSVPTLRQNRSHLGG